MGMFRGHRTSSDLVLLGGQKRIAAPWVWALRLLAVVVVISSISGSATGGPSYAVGALIGAAAVYAVALNLVGSHVEDDDAGE